VRSPDQNRNRQSGSDKKNVHRVGRVSAGLLNPSGGARNRPRNKSVLAQLENELNHNFAAGNEIRLTFFLERTIVTSYPLSGQAAFHDAGSWMLDFLTTDNR